MSPSLVILSVWLPMGLACLSSGVVLLFKRGRRDQLEIEIPKIGKVKTGRSWDRAGFLRGCLLRYINLGL